jgi:hypothetical protein
MRSSEGLLHLKGDLLPQKVITGPGQRVGDRFERHHPVGPLLLVLIAPLHLGVVANGEVRRLSKGPGQLLGAVLGIAAALALSVAHLVTLHTPAIGGNLTHPLKATDIPGPQPDAQPQGRPNALHGQQVLKPWSPLHPLLHHLLQPLNVLNQTPVSRKITLHRPRPTRLGKELLDLGFSSLPDLIRAQPHPRVAAHQVLKAEDVPHLLPHQLTALA